MYKVVGMAKRDFTNLIIISIITFVPDKSLKQEMHLIRKTRGCGRWEGNMWFFWMENVLTALRYFSF
jgi:hypothetical protein